MRFIVRFLVTYPCGPRRFPQRGPQQTAFVASDQLIRRWRLNSVLDRVTASTCVPDSNWSGQGLNVIGKYGLHGLLSWLPKFLGYDWRASLDHEVAMFRNLSFILGLLCAVW